MKKKITSARNAKKAQPESSSKISDTTTKSTSSKIGNFEASSAAQVAEYLKASATPQLQPFKTWVELLGWDIKKDVEKCS